MSLTNRLVDAGWSFHVEEKSANLKIWKDGQGADIDQLQAVVDGMIADAVREIAAERDALKAEVSRLKEDKANLRANFEGEFWVWQGDGSDHLESLTCRVMIQPKQLDRLCKIEAAAKAYRTKRGSDFGCASCYRWEEWIALRDAIDSKTEPPPKLVWVESVDGYKNRQWKSEGYLVVSWLYNNGLAFRAYGMGEAKDFATVDEAKESCERHAEQAKGKP